MMFSRLSCEDRSKLISCAAIFQLGIVALQYVHVTKVVCCIHDPHVPIIALSVMSLTWENVQEPLLLNCTASNGKLGERLGTRLTCCSNSTYQSDLVCLSKWSPFSLEFIAVWLCKLKQVVRRCYVIRVNFLLFTVAHVVKNTHV